MEAACFVVGYLLGTIVTVCLALYVEAEKEDEDDE